MSTIPAKDADGVTRQILNHSESGAEAQVVKLMFGIEGTGHVVTADVPLPVTDVDLTMISRMMLDALQSPAGYDLTQNRVRGTVVLESGTVTTVSTLSNITNINNRNADMLISAMDALAWNAMVGSKVT